MNIGVIGVGCVGGAVKYGMEKLGHTVKVHDILLDTTIEDIGGTEIVYVCVPTPSKESGECDTSIVETVVDDIKAMGYQGIIAIKSTVSPGTTQMLIDKYRDTSICFVPEFLRERCAISDFTENHDVCIVGAHTYMVFDAIKQSHGTYPTEFIMMSPTEAELAKYFNNIYNAAQITFANAFYEVCNKFGADYTSIKNAMVKRPHITDLYLDCNDTFRGFGGMCLPKDTKAIEYICKDDPNVIYYKMLLEQNSKYKTTVLDGMRP